MLAEAQLSTPWASARQGSNQANRINDRLHAKLQNHPVRRELVLRCLFNYVSSSVK